MNETSLTLRMDNDSHLGFSEVSMDSSNSSSTQFYQSWREMSDIVYGIISAILIPCICCGNFLVLISLWKFRKLRTKTNIFVANLSIADSIMGAVSLPMYTAFFFNHEKLEKYKYICITKYSIVVFSSSASLLSLVAIAVDRYVAVLHPLKYHVIVTHKRIKHFLICQWTYDILTFTIPYYWNNYDQYQTCNFYKIFPRVYSVFIVFVSIAICLLVSMFLYIKIFKVARRHRQCLNMPQFTDCNNKQIRKDAKSAKMMAFILFLFFVFWLPFLMVGPLRYLGVAENFMVIIKNITLLIAMSNSMVNPIVYCWLRKEFSLAFKRLCCSCDTIHPRNFVTQYNLQSSDRSSKSNGSNNNGSQRRQKCVPKKVNVTTPAQQGIEIIAHRRLD
ncbi:adenosine receptor A3-like [Argopecten irradians]|uniref:adenosine receptor A3-like n=1 Tax=Argopecten irradians TaxID=31199 RepID=UPI00371F0C3C